MTVRSLRGGGVALVVDVPGAGAAGLARVLHWGGDPGDVTVADLQALAGLSVPARGVNLADVPSAPSLLPGEADGWFGRPGLAATRAGRIVLPRWTTTAVDHDGDGPSRLTVTARDDLWRVSVTITLRLDAAGILTVSQRIDDEAEAQDPLQVTGLLSLLPVPGVATDVLDLTGRWGLERIPQRTHWGHGGRTRESRRGRTGHDATPVIAVGTPDLGWRRGEVWAAHVAWSGNHVHLAERLPDGAGVFAGLIGGGELLTPGEVTGSYTAPDVHYAWSDRGLDGISEAFHRHLRSRAHHPHRLRPVTLNSWEAVYFDHREERLIALAEAAAAVGVERFVLDDGWFGGRRDDTRGLGDWVVSSEVWPRGLAPLVDRVRALGMEFGLWVEPEMVNLDSDLARAHPDWLLAAAGAADPARLPPASRHQYALDLGNEAVWTHLLGRLDALLRHLDIAYLKWDHNRDLAEATGSDGRAGVHAQTAAAYRLLDELRRRHPGLEIESCASGGGRVDLGILARTDRVWTSDTTDALERQSIQRWTGLLVPPELLGAHVSSPRSHQTGRDLDLSFRCLTAFFGHAGIEWDLTTCTPDDLDRVRRWVSAHTRHRELLHTGTTVRADADGPGGTGRLLHGVVAADRSEALYAFVQLTTSGDAVPGRWRLPGLDHGRRYRVDVVDLTGDGRLSTAAAADPPWLAGDPPVLAGALLGGLGLPMPALRPESGVLLHLTEG